MRRRLLLAGPAGLIASRAFADISFPPGGGRGSGSRSVLFFTGTPVGNGADTTEDTLQSFSIPANTLVNVGDTLHILCAGTLAASTDSRAVRVKLATQLVPAVTGTTAAHIKWITETWVSKTGASQQTSWMSAFLTAGSMNGNMSITTTLGDTAPIAFAVTGQNNTNPVAGSITCQYVLLEVLRA